MVNMVIIISIIVHYDDESVPIAVSLHHTKHAWRSGIISLRSHNHVELVRPWGDSKDTRKRSYTL
jgi:hypothetical protein